MLLTAHNITKRYGSLEVLKGIDFAVAQREILAIVGASGAGKSTLLQILGTLDRPDSGTVQLGDTDVLGLKGKALATFRNQRLGFIFQFHNLLPEFTALENVCMPAFLAGERSAKVQPRAMALLERLGIAARAKHLPMQMSGGEAQRVAIARALINQPEIVFADEPSGNLDSRNAEELHRLFVDLRDELGQTFVIVTHNTHLAQISDRRVEMLDGKILSA